MTTIGININNEILFNTDITKYVYESGFEFNKIHFTVICDNSETLNHFNIISNNAKWVTLNRMRNIIDITIEENLSLFERYAAFEFHHNLDNDAVFLFEIIQAPRVYSINIDDSDKNIFFDNLLSQNDVDYQKYDVKVFTDGGMNDFGIKPIQEFVKNDPTSDFYEKIYDNGLKIFKSGKDKLCIVNYGKATLFYDHYYKITLYHINDITKTIEIIVKYNLDVNSGFGF